MGDDASQERGVSLPLFSAEQLNQACDRFAAAWQRGQPLSIEEALADTPECFQSLLIGELLALEIGYRRGRGESPAAADYHPRFPQHARLIRRMFERG